MLQGPERQRDSLERQSGRAASPNPGVFSVGSQPNQHCEQPSFDGGANALLFLLPSMDGWHGKSAHGQGRSPRLDQTPQMQDSCRNLSQTSGIEGRSKLVQV